MESQVNNRWLPRTRLNSHPEFRLFCLPYAGGGASVYRAWPQAVPRQVEVCAVELPGRGSRMCEAPFQRLTPLVRALASAIEPALDRPFALFGHSMGGLVAFELARWLRRQGGPSPRRLFVSASSAPGAPPTLPLLHQAPDTEVKAKLRELGGTPRELLDNDEIMALLIPTLRADLSVLETYEHRPEPPLEVPITVFGGTADRTVRLPALAGWRTQTSAGSRLRLFSGDHFFLHDAATDMLAAILEDLGVAAPRPAAVDAAGSTLLNYA